MKIRFKNLRNLFIAILFVVGEILSSEIAFIIVSILCMWDLVKSNFRVKIPAELWTLTCIVFLGAIGGIFRNYDTRDYLRDFFKTLGPIIYILLGHIYGKNNEYSLQDMISSINLAAIIIGFRSIILKIWVIVNYGLAFDLIREEGGKSSPCIIVAFAVLFLISTSNMPKWIRKKRKLLIGFYVVINFLYLSRTVFLMWLPFIIIYILVYSNNKKGIGLFLKLCIATGILLIFIPSNILEPFISKILRSIQEVSFNNDSWTWLQVNANWRGYETYIINKEFENVSLFQKLIGFGFGKLVGLDYEINLGGELFSSIGIFHNGYSYIYLKAGIIGICCYLLYLTKNFVVYLRMLGKNLNINYCILQMGIIIAFATSSYVIAGFYNGAYFISMCMVFGYLGNKNVRRKLNEY